MYAAISKLPASALELLPAKVATHSTTRFSVAFLARIPFEGVAAALLPEADDSTDAIQLPLVRNPELNSSPMVPNVLSGM